MKSVLVINGHPDPSPERLTGALARAYQKGAEEAGHSVKRIDVGELQFPILRNAEEFARPATNESVGKAQAAFLNADHIVFIFPLWLGGPPALLKAFLEQVACGQFLLRERKHRFPLGGLKGRSASVIVTMGMPALFYRLIFGACGIKAFTQGILRLAGLSPVHTTFFGGSSITRPNSQQLIEKLHHMGRRGS